MQSTLLSVSGAILLAATAHAAPAGALRVDLKIPARRPYLTLTPGEAALARQRATQGGWRQAILAELVRDADGYAAKPWAPLPPKGANEHRAIASRLFRVALAHSLTGERRYAEWTRDGLVAYAKIYPGMSLMNHRMKIFGAGQSPLFEAMWMVQLAQAYDLVAGSGVFEPAQKALVEKDLLRASTVCFKIDDYAHDPRVSDLHYRCYNFQAWHLSAVGLVGLALGDRELVDWAVNSRYGLAHLIAHDIRDDGLFWERSPSYHRFVMSALLPFTEALWRSGVDVYPQQVPNLRTKDEDQHYVTDSSAASKSLRLLWQGPLHLTFPDLTYPALGDSDRGPLRGGWEQLIGYHRYHDRLAAWLLARDHEPGAGGSPPARDWHFLVYDPSAAAPRQRQL